MIKDPTLDLLPSDAGGCAESHVWEAHSPKQLRC